MRGTVTVVLAMLALAGGAVAQEKVDEITSP